MNSSDGMPAANRFGIALLSFFTVGILVDHTRIIWLGPPLSLEKLEAQADLILKGEAIASEAVDDEWFKPVDG
jgi:hypothetical protein